MVHYKGGISTVLILVHGQFHNMTVDSPQDTIPSAEDDCSLRLHTLFEILNIVMEEDPVQQIEQARVSHSILLHSSFQTKVIGGPSDDTEFDVVLDWTRGQDDWFHTQSKSMFDLINLPRSSSGCHTDCGAPRHTIQPQSSAPFHHIRSE